jgi:protein-disulfide isomerase
VKRDRLAPVLAIVGGAIVLVVALVVASQISNNTKKPSAENINTDSVADMLRGIPQKGIELGNSNAKLTLVEFSDPQCPWCGKFARDTFPTIVQNYVRSGKLRLEYRGVDVIDLITGGTDSERMIRLAQAAGLQNRLWDVVELEFENQATEGSGYATDPFLRGIAQSVDKLDANKALAATNTNAVVPMIDAAKQLALAKIGKSFSTPTFLLERAGSKPEEIIGAQPFSVFAAAIDAQLKK